MPPAVHHAPTEQASSADLSKPTGSHRNHRLRGAIVTVAAAAALAFAVPGIAHAADYATGDYDGIEISVVGTTFEIGAHNHDLAGPSFEPASDRFVTDYDGVIYANGRKGLEVGIAAEAGVPANAVLTLESARVSASGTSSQADVEVISARDAVLFNTVADVGGPAAKWSTDAPGGSHVHPTWAFKSGPGVYTLTFSVAAAGYTAASGYTLTFVVP